MTLLPAIVRIRFYVRMIAYQLALFTLLYSFYCVSFFSFGVFLIFFLLKLGLLLLLLLLHLVY